MRDSTWMWLGLGTFVVMATASSSAKASNSKRRPGRGEIVEGFAGRRRGPSPKGRIITRVIRT